MNLFDTDYYKVYRRVLYIASIWPYENFWLQITTEVVFGMNNIVAMKTLIESTYSQRNVSAATWILITPVFVMLILLQLQTCLLVGKKKSILRLHEKIKEDHEIFQTPQEKQIILHHSKMWQKLFHRAAALTGTSAIYCIGSPLLTKGIDLIMPLDEPRRLNFAFDDVHTSRKFKSTYEFVKIQILFYVASLFIATACTSVCGMYWLLASHACSMLRILGNKLKYMDPNKHIIQKELVKCIHLHQDYLIYLKTLQNIYELTTLVALITSLLNITLNSVSLLLHINSVHNVIRVTSIIIITTLHLYLLSLPGQDIIDYTDAINRELYESPWHDFPQNSKEIVKIIQVRTAKCFKITAGKLYALNFESFSKVLQTSVSYFTVLCTVAET